MLPCVAQPIIRDEAGFLNSLLVTFPGGVGQTRGGSQYPGQRLDAAIKQHRDRHQMPLLVFQRLGHAQVQAIRIHRQTRRDALRRQPNVEIRKAREALIQRRLPYATAAHANAILDAPLRQYQSVLALVPTNRTEVARPTRSCRAQRHATQYSEVQHPAHHIAAKGMLDQATIDRYGNTRSGLLYSSSTPTRLTWAK